MHTNSANLNRLGKGMLPVIIQMIIAVSRIVMFVRILCGHIV
jgi:hypothetical protein